MARLHRHRQIPPLLQAEDVRQARSQEVDQVADGHEVLILQPQGEGCQGEMPYIPLKTPKIWKKLHSLTLISLHFRNFIPGFLGTMNVLL